MEVERAWARGAEEEGEGEEEGEEGRSSCPCPCVQTSCSLPLSCRRAPPTYYGPTYLLWPNLLWPYLLTMTLPTYYGSTYYGPTYYLRWPYLLTLALLATHFSLLTTTHYAPPAPHHARRATLGAARERTRHWRRWTSARSTMSSSCSWSPGSRPAQVRPRPPAPQPLALTSALPTDH